jgi:methionyl aminopeptidase
MIVLKSDREIALIRNACKIVGEILRVLGEEICEGMTTLDLDKRAQEIMKKRGGIPSFLGYRGFPAHICTSINQEVVHGIPDTSRVIKEGDIVGVDVGVQVEGYHGDAARTFAVGSISHEIQRLLDITRESLDKGIEQFREGGRLSDIGHAVQSHAEGAGFSVVRQFVGHGIGRDLHEDPQVPNYGKPGRGPRLTTGMTLAIEPMINMGSPEVEVLDDEWTVVTRDQSLSAHFEDTIALTDHGAEVMTNA